MATTFVKNAADEKQVAEADKKTALAKRREGDEIRYVLSDRRGRRYLWNLLGVFGLNKIAFVQGHPDATSFELGMQNAAQLIKINITEVDPAMWLQMQREALEDEKE